MKRQWHLIGIFVWLFISSCSLHSRIHKNTVYNPEDPAMEKSSKRKAVQCDSLLETYWKLIELNGLPISNPDGSEREAHIMLKEIDGKVFGSGGCNKFSGNFELSGNQIRFSQVISTKMACENIPYENEFFTVLRQTDNYILEHCALLLRKGDSVLARFNSQATIEKDLKSHFEKYGVDGCFVLFDENVNRFIKYNSLRCDSGFIPASTFKIPHALIALEEGIIRDTNQVIHWDGREWPVTSWNQDQTLRTSMKYSCVWVYTGFASQIGIDKYYHYVNDFDYGNKDLTGPPDRFWLAGSFRISADQQVDFLSRFYHYKLPVSRQNVNTVKKILIQEKSENYTISAKTGGGMLSDNDYVMWLVGYVEKAGNVYYFAMNFTSQDFDKTSRYRYDITTSILKELKVI